MLKTKSAYTVYRPKIRAKIKKKEENEKRNNEDEISQFSGNYTNYFSFVCSGGARNHHKISFLNLKIVKVRKEQLLNLFG